MNLNATDNEQMLTLRMKKGDEQAMRMAYGTYVRYLTGVCSRYITSDDDVKDVLQETFLKIFAAIDTFQYRGEGSLKAWMTRIALNETMKFLRRNFRLDFVELKPEAVDIADEQPNTDGIPPDVIHEMIRELPDGYRAVFNLYVVEEKSHKEIAQLLGIKENSSASQLHRAKALLAEKIKKYNTIKTEAKK